MGLSLPLALLRFFILVEADVSLFGLHCQLFHVVVQVDHRPDSKVVKRLVLDDICMLFFFVFALILFLAHVLNHNLILDVKVVFFNVLLKVAKDVLLLGFLYVKHLFLVEEPDLLPNYLFFVIFF